MTHLKTKLLLPLLLLFHISCVSQEAYLSSDWPQWRGPDRKGIWYNGPDIKELSMSNVKQIWETPVGPGYSGPTVANGYVYITDYLNGSERVLCLDDSNGRKIWGFDYECEYNVGYPTGPRASVLVWDGLAYSFGTMGHLYCFDALTGDIKWQKNGEADFNSRIPTWGLVASPIIEGNLLIVQMGGSPGACLVAFDRFTGQEIWRALDDNAGYAAPIIIDQAGKRVLICWTAESFAGLDPATGKVLWSLPFSPRKSMMNVATPVYNPPFLFLSAFFDGSYLLKLSQEETSAELVYHRYGQNEKNTDALHCCISTPIIKGNYVYGIDSYGEVRCLDLKTGDRIWENLDLVREGRWSNIHFVEQDNFVWGFNEEGELLYGKFTPSGYEDLGRVKLIDPVGISPNPRDGVCWAHPAFAGNRVYLRSDEKLVCVKIE